MDEILRIDHVVKLTKLSKSTIQRLIDLKKFPPSMSLADRAVGWLSSEIEKWMKERKIKQ